jgi:glycosyltransferase involved in cell wall biosynthesis
VEDGVEGFLVPGGDEKLLADRISVLASSPSLRRSMAAAARRRARDFDWFTCTETYLALFGQLIKSDVDTS